MTYNRKLKPVSRKQPHKKLPLHPQIDIRLFGKHQIKYYHGEFWTAAQRQMNPLHYVVSYRGSYKPELPEFFIRKYSSTGDTILDPFGGRATTLLQANIMKRRAIHNDINPISALIARAKSRPVSLTDIEQRLHTLKLAGHVVLNGDSDLQAFYHKKTLTELINLKHELLRNPDPVNEFIRLIALSRLHGHSNGFFSVYTFPMISIPLHRQKRINTQRNQKPEYREIIPRIIKKARRVLHNNNLSTVTAWGAKNTILTDDSQNLSHIQTASVDLIVTSPPFLAYVDYIHDNWLKCWFLGVDPESLKDKIVQTTDLNEWKSFIHGSLKEMGRVLKTGKYAVVEVGDVNYRGTRLNLDELIIALSHGTRLIPKAVYINQQEFTKMANCFKVSNNEKGTNTNRCVILQRI